MRTTRAKKSTTKQKMGLTERKQTQKLAKLLCITGLAAACALSVCHAFSTTSYDPRLGIKPLKVEEDIEPSFTYREPISLGDYRITFYCSCADCCGEWANNRPIDKTTGETLVYGSSGVLLTPGYSCATSRDFAIGTPLKVEGFGDVKVDDRPAQWVLDKFDNKVVDIYMNDHDEIKYWQKTLGDYAEVKMYEHIG